MLKKIGAIYLLLFFALLEIPVPASAAFISGRFEDDPLKYAGIALHGAVAPSANHNLATVFARPAGDAVAEWEVTGTITETDAATDKLKIDGKVTHKIPPAGAPHGEGANPNSLSFLYDVTAGVAPFTTGFKTDIKLDQKDHKTHFDGLVSTLQGSVNDNKSVEAYVLTIAGGHDVTNPKLITDDPSFFSASMILDSNLNFTLALGAFDLSLTDLNAAHIRLGSPAIPGPIIVDLLPSLFFDMDGLGIGRIMLESPFPATDVNSLLASNTFIELQTAEGNFTSELHFVPEPSTLTLLGLGAISLLAYGWRRPSKNKWDQSGRVFNAGYCR